jgi:DNA primase
MSLPPGFLDELRSRVSLSQVVGRKVTWDLRKSNQGKGDMWAPCPFHQERSASFHVDDRKGFYYCFGCQAKGDAVSFLKHTENLSFLEAVEWLAREAGMPMPARDPQAAQKAEAAKREARARKERRASKKAAKAKAAKAGGAAAGEL